MSLPEPRIGDRVQTSGCKGRIIAPENYAYRADGRVIVRLDTGSTIPLPLTALTRIDEDPEPTPSIERVVLNDDQLEDFLTCPLREVDGYLIRLNRHQRQMGRPVELIMRATHPATGTACPTCGSPVTVVTDNDGTSHYQPNP